MLVITGPRPQKHEDQNQPESRTHKEVYDIDMHGHSWKTKLLGKKRKLVDNRIFELFSNASHWDYSATRKGE